MYCSIQEAWPEHKFISKNVEHFRQEQPITTSTTVPIHLNDVNKCNNIIDHIETCPYCQNYIRQKYYKNQIIDFININPQLKETIIVFLIGIVIIFILNIFCK